MRAITVLLSSADRSEQAAALLLLDSSVWVPASTGSPQGAMLAARNRMLIGGSGYGISEAMVRVLERDMDERPLPVLHVAAVCMEAISKLLTRALRAHRLPETNKTYLFIVITAMIVPERRFYCLQASWPMLEPQRRRPPFMRRAWVRFYYACCE